MAKYARPRGGDVVVQTRFCGVGEGGTFSPVIVLPEAEWRKIVEMTRDFECEYYEDNCNESPDPPCFSCVIHAIIQRTEAENG
jgi:hypothetical protein